VVADRSARQKEARRAVNNNSAYDSSQKRIPIVAAGSHHLTNFDADSAQHAASPHSDSVSLCTNPTACVINLPINICDKNEL
jgi:hypothetical protein